MQTLITHPYNRQAAVDYANYWAWRRNPAYYDFEDIGGDCTNFASQCILAGADVMNFTPDYGWYYLDLNHRAPAWTGVVYLYNFLTTNQGVGPFATQVGIEGVEPGDICQIRMEKPIYQHTPVITRIQQPVTPDTIWIAAHSNDADCRPLSTYPYVQLRFLHIEGYRR